jgi:TonB-dependent receptor
VNEEAGWSGGGGNKNLKPFVAWQSDVSLEYYYGEGSALGLNVFYKDIDNFVVPLLVTAVRDVPQLEFPTVGESAGGDGIVIENYSTNANGTNAVSQGVEVFIQHHFENGFGVTGNYTVNDTNKADVSVSGVKMGESKLLGSSDFQFNSSVFFEDDDFSARISYTLRGKTSLGLQNGMQTYLDEYQQVDANVSYSLMDDLILTASVINLTEEDQFSYIGDDTKDRYLSKSYSGRRFYAGISYKF